MRTTVTIDDDILLVARTIAHDTNRSVGDVLSAMARRGLSAQSVTRDDLGIPLFEVSENAPLFGPDQVAEGEDDL